MGAWEVFGLNLRDPWTLMVPIDHEAVKQGTSYRGNAQLAFYIVAALFFIIGLVHSEVVRTKLEWKFDYLVATLQDREFWFYILDYARNFFLNYVLTAFTVRSITQVVFTDWVLCLTLLIDEASLSSQPEAHKFQEEKRKVLAELNDGL